MNRRFIEPSTAASCKRSALLFLLASIAGSNALAHGGADKPLFVAPGGADQGGCLDPGSPCRTIGYALSVAGKGAEIRIAAGTYEIESPEDLFHIVSSSVNVVGGFSRRDGFQRRGADTTTLTGVPFQYRELLESRGFNVISDTKGIDSPEAAAAEKLLGVYRQLKSGAPSEPCAGGMAGDLQCDSVDLLSHLAFADLSTQPSAANDVWGFVDLNTGREYAIAGFDIGTAVIDVTDPENPVEVGFIDGQRTTWRDIKIYQFFDAAESRWQAYAYVTADAATDGLFIIDLGGLPHRVRKAAFAGDFASAHNIYMTGADYSTGIALHDAPPLLAIAGSNIAGGGFRMYSLADPAVPEVVSGGSALGYMHDSSSLVISDARKDTQCVNGGAYCEVMLDFNEDTVDVWDLTQPSNPVRLSSTPYANSAYVHSGWWSEDRQFVFVHDELDEQRLGLPTTLRVFSIADLGSPVQVGSWSGPTNAIDHNGFVRGNRYYMANYSRGMTVLDISDPALPVTAGFLDTYPFSNAPGFQGAWGAYPFFFSNTVAVQDIDSGLYLARDRTLDVPGGRLGFDSKSAAAEEALSARLTVQRSGGSSGAVSVAVEFLDATTDAADYQPPSAVLSWADGDASTRTIDIPLVNDGAAEGLERLFVRLVTPEGGATLGDINVASVFLSDPGAPSGIGLFADTIEIAERGFSTAVVVFRRSGSALGAASVDYSVTGGSATAGTDYEGSTSGTVPWPAGDGTPRTLAFDILDDGVAESDEAIELTLANPVGATIDGRATVVINVLDGSGSSAAPNAIAGTSQTVTAESQVTLDGNQSNDPDGDGLTFLWEQTIGPDVTLTDADTAIARFTAPAVNSDTMLQFRLTVTDASGLSDTVTTTVTVVTAASNDGGSGGGSAGWWLIAMLTVVAGSQKLEKSPQSKG